MKVRVCGKERPACREGRFGRQGCVWGGKGAGRGLCWGYVWGGGGVLGGGCAGPKQLVREVGVSMWNDSLSPRSQWRVRK